jgi:hypothetical protein
MAHPNFFLIGAQKCGTDALYAALKQHPNIFMSPQKEPAYFTMDGALPEFRIPTPGYRHRLVYDREKYLALFADAGDHPVIGEASAIYLSSYFPARTAARIAAAAPHARIAALLRQPADRAYSAHAFYRARDLEPIADFRAALAAEEERIRTREIPDIRHRANSMYYANLTPYFDVFPRAQIRVYLHDDLLENPRRVLRDLFEFLDVPDQPDITLPRTNVTWLNRSQALWRFLERPTPRQMRLRRRIPAAIAQRLLRWNRFRPPPLDPALRRSLTNEFRTDILRLATLIDRDLSHWL